MYGYKIHKGKNRGIKVTQLYREVKCEKCGENHEGILIVHYKDWDYDNFGMQNLEILCYNCYGILCYKERLKIKPSWNLKVEKSPFDS